ncbi:hypothetical protein VN97_g6254 [Penicillium thymicola]|uniref:Uncharacterized protein n=1 Tax=Penicillium thymicola TaxID=293382 RepID=A0AAI9THY0_PENTH|nr:hypothetical protein VN97_g6254 [Penicillium thymicola]
MLPSAIAIWTSELAPTPRLPQTGSLVIIGETVFPFQHTPPASFEKWHAFVYFDSNPASCLPNNQIKPPPLGFCGATHLDLESFVNTQPYRKSSC